MYIHLTPPPLTDTLRSYKLTALHRYDLRQSDLYIPPQILDIPTDSRYIAPIRHHTQEHTRTDNMARVKKESEPQTLVLRRRAEAIYLCGIMKRIHYETGVWIGMDELRRIHAKHSSEELEDIWSRNVVNWYDANIRHGKWRPRKKADTSMRFLRKKVKRWHEILWPGKYKYDPGPRTHEEIEEESTDQGSE